MRQFNILRGTKGFVSVYNHIIKTNNMTPESIKKAKIISHFNKYGLESTLHAFKTSRRSIYRWKRELKLHSNHLNALNNKTTRPNRLRQRIINLELKEEIIRLRIEHPHIGKRQIYHLIKSKIKTSESTVGRYIKILKEKNLLPLRGQKPYKYRKKVKKIRRMIKQGFEVDTVVRHIYGTKWYFVNAIDINTRKAFSHLSINHSSKEAKEIFKHIDITIQELQTDNGSEFLDLFHDYCNKHNIRHNFTYPSTPKMNAHIERFNRTLEEEFIKWNRQLMLDRDRIDELRDRLKNYINWYNNVRPHSSLGFVSPQWYIDNQIVPKVVN